MPFSSGAETWTANELDLLIDTYHSMLERDLASEEYSKRQHSLRLQEKINRSYASIDFQFCNLSAILRDSGRAYIETCTPLAQRQIVLHSRVVERIEEFPRVDNHKRLSEADNNVESTIWAEIAKLWDRSTGGGDVAYRPEIVTGNELPTAPRPAGVEESCGWFAHGLETASIPRFLFLAGGPGAGKSHAAGSLVRGYEKLSPVEDGLAHRRYTYSAGPRQTVLINDATIPSTEYPHSPLARDIDETVRAGNHLIVCVNRGILVEEKNAFSGKSSANITAGEALVKWLTFESASSGQEWKVSNETTEDYFRTGRLISNGIVLAELVVVYVDVCSLLEKKPSVIVDFSTSETSLKPQPYKIADFDERAIWLDDHCPAGDLLSRVIDDLSNFHFEAIDSRYNPIAANISSLSSSAGRSAFLSLLRAAEIVNGQRFTYRTIWGAIVRALIAGLPEEIVPSKLPESIAQMGVIPSDPLQLFYHMRDLANYRCSQALFGIEATSAGTDSDPRRNPVTRLTSLIDPMRDAVPGYLSDMTKAGWATPVTDAFAGPTTLSSPLCNIEATIHAEDGFHNFLTDFDRTLDKSFADAMNVDRLPDNERFEIIHWYGSYLGRLYAVANGIPAFKWEISLWTESWCLQPSLPDTISNGMRTLLRPKRIPGHPDSASLIPIFDSRTDPIVGNQIEPKLALQTSDFRMTTETRAEELFLILKEGGVEIARMLLDFSLLREATVCGNDHPGMTDLTEATSPRLERFRAARLVPDRLNKADYRIVTGAKQEILTVAGGA